MAIIRRTASLHIIGRAAGQDVLRVNGAVQADAAPEALLDDLRVHAVGRHLERIEDVHAQRDDALDERHDGAARVKHDLHAVAVRHVHQLRQPRGKEAVEQPRADQQPVLRAQVVGDAQDVDPARARP